MPRRIVVVLLACVPLGCCASASAASCPNEQLRAENNSLKLPDCRSYEMVSPADKNGGAVNFEGYFGSITGVSATGERALFGSFTGFAGIEGVTTNSYWADRTSTGWVTTPASVPPTPNRAGFTGANPVGVAGSRDLATVVFSTNDSWDPLDQDGETAEFTTLDVYAARHGFPMEWASRPNTEAPDATPAEAAYRAVSEADGSHVVFESEERFVAPESGPAQTQGPNLFDRTGGYTYLVGVTSTGELAGQCGVTTPNQAIGARIVSADGSEVAFKTRPCGATPSELYLRIGNQRTVEVSRSRVPLEPGVEFTFETMSPDGGRVFFLSNQALTPGAPSEGGTYEYDVADDSLHYLLPAVSVQRTSWDGTRVYFQSASQFSTAPPGGGTYLIERGGTPTYVGPAATGEQTAVSRDGRFFAFAGEGPLGDGHKQVYRFDAETAQSTCVSCPPHGATPTGDASLTGGFGESERAGYVPEPRNVSEDGRVFFQSPDRLTAADGNSKLDVYEYADGEAHLISAGQSDEPAFLVGASADGRDVMFVTSQSLVGQDGDGATDVYDARIGGGLPAPAGGGPGSCAGDACQGQPSAPPPTLAAASVTFLGAGNILGVQPSVSTKVFVSKSKTVFGSRGAVRVILPAKGSLILTGSGLKTLKKNVSRGSTVTLSVSLTARAAKALRKRKVFKTKVMVLYKPSGGKSSTATVSLTFKIRGRA
jgi:hypothetical protein